MPGKLPEECKKCGIDPKLCPLHESEHERSKRNEKDIANLWEHYGKLGDEMRAGLKEVTASITESQKVILGALAGTRTGFEGPGRGGGT